MKMLKEFLENRQETVKINEQLRENLAQQLFDKKNNNPLLMKKILIPLCAFGITIVIIGLNLIGNTNSQAKAEQLLSNADKSISSLVSEGKILHMNILNSSQDDTSTVNIWTDLKNFRTELKDKQGETVYTEDALMTFDESSEEFTLYKASLYNDGNEYFIEQYRDLYATDETLQPDFDQESSAIRQTNTFAGLPVNETFYNLDTLRSVRGCDDCYATEMISEITGEEEKNGEMAYKIETRYPDEIRNGKDAPDEASFDITTWISKDRGIILAREISSNGLVLLTQNFSIETIEKPYDDFFTYDGWHSQEELKNLTLQETP